MPELRRRILDSIKHAAVDKSLTDLLEQQIRKCAAGRAPPDYLYLTELLNPAEAYWQRTAPEPHPIETLKLLKYGQKMHYAARYWFRALPGFVAAEAVLNGHYVGVPGVVGRADYMMDGGILEFKTKERASVSTRDVLELFPQDLEQTVFYAALSPSPSDENSLVYMTRAKNGSARFTAFRAEVETFEPVKEEMIRRAADLRKRLKADDPEGLPRCRYHPCRFESAGRCDCANAAPIDPSPVFDAVKLSEDRSLARATEAAYEATRFQPDEEYDEWDLILPRKWYHGHFDYTIDEELATYSGFDPDKLALWALIDSAVAASDLGVAAEDRRALLATDLIGVAGMRRFMKVNLPAKGEGTVAVPYVRKRHAGAKVPGERDLPDIYYAELAVQCARAGMPNGVIVVHFPRAGSRTICYSIGFELDKIRRAATGAKNALDTARVKGSPDDLEKCPDYMRDRCQYAGCSCREG